MMSNEEMVRNVFRRTDEYFQKKEKRNNTIKKGASFMSLFSIITIAGLGLWSSNTQSPVIPEEQSEIAIVQTVYETTETAVSSENSDTQTVVVTSVPLSQSIGTTGLMQTSNVTTTVSVTTAPVNIQTTVGVTSSVTVTVNENNTTTARTTVSHTVTTEETVSTTTTALPETEPSPAATDLDKSIYNVVSVGDDFITVELSSGASYDYSTFYNRPATMHHAYVWSYVETDFYVVTADSEEKLAGIVLPDGAEIAVIEYSGNNTSWEYIDEKTIISELTDPYILVKGAKPEELYKIDGVKDVYDVNAYTSTSASIVNSTSLYVITSELDKKLTIDDFAGIDGIVDVKVDFKSYDADQMYYHVEFDNPEESYTCIFNMCKRLIELEAVDCAFPYMLYNEVYYYPVHVVEIVENTNTDDEEKTEVTVIGDIDGNGTVDISDATAVLSMYAESAAGITPAIYTSAANDPADVNGDGTVNLDDAAAILAYYAQTASGLSPDWADLIY